MITEYVDEALLLGGRCLLLLVSLNSIAAPRLRADIIIDDFDDPVQIVLPEMEDQPQVTEGVGELLASRTVYVGESQTDPIGLVDVDMTTQSRLTARIDGQFLDNPQNVPLLAFGSAYEFGSAADFTKGGINDALFIDMTIFRGSGIPPALSVVVGDANDVFAAIISGFRLPSDSPYTLTLPFSSFGFRGGGGVGLADFSTIDLLDVTVRLLQGSRNPDTNWFVQIDRIRVGRAVPEPQTWQLELMVALLLAAFANRRYCSQSLF
jgi:hypothetical protein